MSMDMYKVFSRDIWGNKHTDYIEATSYKEAKELADIWIRKTTNNSRYYPYRATLIK